MTSGGQCHEDVDRGLLTAVQKRQRWSEGLSEVFFRQAFVFLPRMGKGRYIIIGA